MDSGNGHAKLESSRSAEGEVDMKMLRGTTAKSGRTTRACRGESMVEFALVAPLFFLLVFGITDFGRLFFVQETLQFALREAGRFAVTGQNSGTNRVTAIKQVAEKTAAGLGLTDSSIQIISGGVTNYAGGPRETMTISMNYGLKLITPMIGKFFGPSQTYTCRVSVTFMNEPFDPSQSN
jgi:Flp pilus assembly protein TadG